MQQNAMHSGKPQPGFDLTKFRYLVTPGLEQEDLLCLITLRHRILIAKNFSVEHTWRPIIQGVDKVPFISDCLTSSPKLSRGESEDSKEAIDAMNKPLGEVNPNALQPLPALPAPTVTAKPGLDGLPSAFRTPPIIGPLPLTPQVHLFRAALVKPATSFADNNLDLIEAELIPPVVPVPEEMPGTESSPILDSGSSVLDSSLLVIWSNLDAPEVPVNDPACPPVLPRIACLLIQICPPPGATLDILDLLRAFPCLLQSKALRASPPTKTPFCKELGPTFLRSTPELASRVYTSVYSREFLRLSLPQSIHLTAALAIGNPACVTRGKYLQGQ
ncbi:hypothetical protein GYMLUDRAFT_245954 [Collybiopsis luxurians FD-317 M1]|uniref:Uncharacterized protein n=1 Tax=Collybiopsis luxurians FD-317 M1 TaxID=944289 RepID=A0A0D0BT63_9AGAR|nr:hypothetical protein GYMLUDRAFT_245954 [Collybiopsis luxurians FD-317 M1]